MTGRVIQMFPTVGSVEDLAAQLAAVVPADGAAEDGNTEFDVIRQLAANEAQQYVCQRMAYALERLVQHPHDVAARRDARLALAAETEYRAMLSGGEAS